MLLSFYAVCLLVLPQISVFWTFGDRISTLGKICQFQTLVLYCNGASELTPKSVFIPYFFFLYIYIYIYVLYVGALHGLLMYLTRFIMWIFISMTLKGFALERGFY